VRLRTSAAPRARLTLRALGYLKLALLLVGVAACTVAIVVLTWQQGLARVVIGIALLVLGVISLWRLGSGPPSDRPNRIR